METLSSLVTQNKIKKLKPSEDLFNNLVANANSLDDQNNKKIDYFDVSKEVKDNAPILKASIKKAIEKVEKAVNGPKTKEEKRLAKRLNEIMKERTYSMISYPMMNNNNDKYDNTNERDMKKELFNRHDESINQDKKFNDGTKKSVLALEYEKYLEKSKSLNNNNNTQELQSNKKSQIPLSLKEYTNNSLTPLQREKKAHSLNQTPKTGNSLNKPNANSSNTLLRKMSSDSNNGSINQEKKDYDPLAAYEITPVKSNLERNKNIKSNKTSSSAVDYDPLEPIGEKKKPGSSEEQKINSSTEFKLPSTAFLKKKLDSPDSPKNKIQKNSLPIKKVNDMSSKTLVNSWSTDEIYKSKPKNLILSNQEIEQKKKTSPTGILTQQKKELLPNRNIVSSAEKKAQVSTNGKSSSYMNEKLTLTPDKVLLPQKPSYMMVQGTTTKVQNNGSITNPPSKISNNESNKVHPNRIVQKYSESMLLTKRSNPVALESNPKKKIQLDELSKIFGTNISKPKKKTEDLDLDDYDDNLSDFVVSDENEDEALDPEVKKAILKFRLLKQSSMNLSDDDDDDEAMEAKFDDIELEEERSRKYAEIEDKLELRRIKEEHYEKKKKIRKSQQDSQ